MGIWRTFTPRERELLMGFTRNYTSPVSNKLVRAALLGNAFHVGVVARLLLDTMPPTSHEDLLFPFQPDPAEMSIVSNSGLSYPSPHPDLNPPSPTDASTSPTAQCIDGSFHWVENSHPLLEWG
jgi:hypothetical protein